MPFAADQALAACLGAVPRARLGIFPTPVHLLPSLGKTVGTTRLYVKRDDLTGLALGGNKTRSLEYLLGLAIAEGADLVICGGGPQSNMARLCAAACARLDLACILVHNAPPPARHQGNMLLNRLLGAKSVFAGRISEAERDAYCESLAGQWRRRGRRPYVVAHGGSTPTGALGFAAGALELHRQNLDQQLGIAHVVICGAMGGTAAGLVLGAAVLGGPFHVHVISVEYPPAELRRRLDELIHAAHRILATAHPRAAAALDPRPLDRVVTIHGGYLGPGYGQPTSASRRALIDAARREALLCEPVYTAKTLAGCLDLLAHGGLDPTEASCFWHTGGAGALFGLAEEVSATVQISDGR